MSFNNRPSFELSYTVVSLNGRLFSYNKKMEKRTQATERKEAFAKQAQAAKDLGDTSLRRIDHVLKEQEEHLAWLEYEGYTPEQADLQLRSAQPLPHSGTTGNPEMPSAPQ